ncbi:acyltransferase domain-containing protein [Frigoribacterium sp. 2-23]|uniref:acyltransferase domain-containing protein n=1 Tax=Frigoribacterium sp. 2-23 TaxID=3415006 RepID=UPI003C6F931F
MIDVRARLTDAELPRLLERLGFRGQDVDDALAAAATVAADPERRGRVERLAEALVARIGDVPTNSGHDGSQPFGSPDAAEMHDEAPDGSDAPGGPRGAGRGLGVLPLLALVVTAAEVHEYHRGRGIDDDTAWRSLSDLGQQVWVHRQTYGSFGLHTQEWLLVAWSGALHWLGRLQFELTRDPDAAGHSENPEPVALATHVPQSGPLTPESVDDAFAQARRFVAEHYPELTVTSFTCDSWLLDPELAAALPPGSNITAFQRRWQLTEEARVGDEDALFFTFRRRGSVDLDSLPQTTSLERAVVGRLRRGEHWTLRTGRLAF